MDEAEDALARRYAASDPDDILSGLLKGLEGIVVAYHAAFKEYEEAVAIVRRHIDHNSSPDRWARLKQALHGVHDRLSIAARQFAGPDNPEKGHAAPGVVALAPAMYRAASVPRDILAVMASDAFKAARAEHEAKSVSADIRARLQGTIAPPAPAAADPGPATPTAGPSLRMPLIVVETRKVPDHLLEDPPRTTRRKKRVPDGTRDS